MHVEFLILSSSVNWALSYPHFIDKETEIQKASVIWSRAHSLIRNELGLLIPGLVLTPRLAPSPCSRVDIMDIHTS